MEIKHAMMIDMTVCIEENMVLWSKTSANNPLMNASIVTLKRPILLHFILPLCLMECMIHKTKNNVDTIL